MAADDAPKAFEHIVLLAVEGLGLGVTSGHGARAAYGDSLGHLWAYAGPLELPFLRWLGLGKLRALPGLENASPPAASFGLLPPPTRDVDDAIRRLKESFETAGVRLSDYPDDGRGSIEARMERLVERLLDSPDNGLVHLFRVHLGGPEGGPVAVGRRLEHLDQALGRLQPVLNEAHLMLLFGVSGQDVVVRPHPSDIHECRPLLAYTPAAPSGIGLGTRGGLRDIVATTLEALGTRPGDTHSFLRPLLA